MSDGWSGLLAEGEHILWQGQPEPGIDWRAFFGPSILIGAFFTLFSMIWIGMSASMISGSDVPFPFQLFPLFGLPFLLVGPFMLGGHVIWDAFIRSQTWYSLSTRQAFVAQQVFGRRKLTAHPIAEMGRINLIDGQPGDIIFGVSAQRRQIVRKGPGRSGVQMGLSLQNQGFFRIAEARKVYRMLRDQQTALREGEDRENA